MRILHYLSIIRREDLLSQYLTMLTTAQAQLGAEVCVVTKRDKLEEKVNQFRPHIVHIHTLWGWNAAHIAEEARKANCGVVVSPHGQLDAYRSRHERKWSKKLYTMSFQRGMLSGADSLFATDQREVERLTHVGGNSHIDLIGNPLLNASVTPDDAGRKTLQLYRKVLDTRYAKYLTPNEDKALGWLLHAAIDNLRFFPLTEEQTSLLHSLDGAQWRRICLWAADEDVLHLVTKAVGLLDIAAPLGENDPSKIDRYPHPHPKQMGELPAKKILNATLSMKEKLIKELEDASGELIKLTVMLLNARSLSRRKELSLHHLCDLYQNIKFLDYDEEQLKALLQRFSLTGYTRSVVGFLHQKLLLTEGFMPVKPSGKYKRL